MKKGEAVAELRRRHRVQARRLARTGLILQGTITAHTPVRPDSGERARAKTYGPYYQWTFKRAGKTVTVALSAGQAQLYQKAIDRHRELEAILREMRDLSRAICEATTEGVKKRKRKSGRQVGLS